MARASLQTSIVPSVLDSDNGQFSFCLTPTLLYTGNTRSAFVHRVTFIKIGRNKIARSAKTLSAYKEDCTYKIEF